MLRRISTPQRPTPTQAMRPFGKITLLWRISQEIFGRDLLPFAAKTRTFLSAPPTKCDVARDFLPSQRTFLAHAPSFLFVPLNRAPKAVDFCAKHGCFSRKLHCFFAKLVHFLTDPANHERKGKTPPRKGGKRRAKLTETDAHRGISRFVGERRAPLLAHVFAKSRSFLNAQRQKQPPKMQKAAADVGGRAQNL